MQQAGKVTYHPQLNDEGQRVVIHKPRKPSEPHTWTNPTLVATFVPGGPVPAELNGIPFTPWRNHPKTAAEWNAYEGLKSDLHEKPMQTSPGKKAAAGVVVLERDGRVWTVHPSNGYGNYDCTFAKGRVEGGLSFQASAVREAMEESGLKVRITALLGDFERTTTRTRYYLAERTGGCPSACGWESEACTLAPLEALPALLNGAADAPVLAALMTRLANGKE